MREVVSRSTVLLHISLLLIQCNLPKSLSNASENVASSESTRIHHTSSHLTSVSHFQAPTPEAPSPMMPFTYKSVPTLSGECPFNFSSAESLLKVTATDCWSSLAPYLANAVCCPQYEASLVILLGQSSKHTGILGLNETHASHCISDVDKILESQGAHKNLQQICSTAPSNLTGASCPIIDANEVERILSSSDLVATCEQIDMTDECCNRFCRNAISAAAQKLAFRNYSMATLRGNPISPEDSVMLHDSANIALRWLASKLRPSTANRVLRGISSCTINEACPLVFPPDISQISNECQIQMKNQTSCCDAMKSYMSYLQDQTFITNSQALNCASVLSMKLQKRANISSNIYNLCGIYLRDFSIQVDPKESGCILPSLPFDVTFNQSSGIGFNCDLGDNIAAPWDSSPVVYPSSCNKTVSSAIRPELPKASSTQSGFDTTTLLLASFLSISLIL